MFPARRLRLTGARLWPLWSRAALRRPLRGLLIVAGLLAMSVVTVAAMVAGDALETLFIADARAQWGAVDVVVARPGDAVIDESTAVTAGLQGAGADAAWAPRLVLDTVVTTGRGRFESQSQVLGLSAEEASFSAPLTGSGKVDPVLLAPDEVILNHRIATRLQAGIGDEVELVIAVPEVVEREPNRPERAFDPRAERWTATVAGIADDTGVADFGRTANVLARLDSLQRVAILPGKVTALYVGAPQPGRDAAEEMAAAFETVGRQYGLLAVEAKEDALDIARDEGGLFRGILLTLALLVVLASAAVTANLVVLLGQERAAEIAVLRAVGVRRARVARLFTVEAGIYALVATLVGALLALWLADYLATAIADHFAQINAGRGREQVALNLQARPGTVVAAVLAVLAVALLTARAAARRVARVDVAETLRGGAPLLPPAGTHRRRSWVRDGGLLVLGMGLAASDAADLLRFLGLSLLLGAWWLGRRGAVPAGPQRRSTDQRAALIGLAWCVVAPAALGDFAKGVQSSFGVLTLAGVGAVTCATVLAAWRMPAIMRLLRLNAPRRWQAALRTAGSHAGFLPSRTGTVVGTIAGVLFMVAALSVLGSATDVGAARQNGGYDVIGAAAVQVDTQQLAAVRGVVHLDALPHTVMGESWFETRDDDDESASVPYPVRAVRLSSPFVTAQDFGLVTALPQYPDTTAVLEAVMEGRGVVLDRYARPEGAQPGDDVVIDDGRGPATFELLGVLDTFVLQGVLLGTQDYDDLFPLRGPTLVLAAGGEGTRPEDLASDLAAAAADRGLAIVPISAAADEVVRINRAFTDIFAVLLQLGLAVALVAVAVLLARSVRERRAGLAVLRAMGFSRRDLLLTLLAEPVLQAATGVIIGLAIGLGVLWLLFTRGFADLAFVVQWRSLALLSAGVVGLVAVTSLLPAARAARRDPAADLRDLG